MKNVLLSIATAFALLFGLATTLSAQNTVVWKGGTPGQENNWNCPKNWSKYKVPDEFSDVVIPDVSSTTHATPVIKSGTFEVNSIQIQSNAQLTIESGARLVVYPLAATAPGVLEVTAEHGGQSYGPILLTVIRYACYAYSAPCAVQNELGGWLRVPDNFAYSSSSGSAITQYGGADGSILIGASGATTIHYSAMSGVSEVYVYCNDGGDGYFIVNGDTVHRANQRGAFAPPWLFPATPTVTVSGLSSIQLVSDGYGSPFYVFVR